MRRTKNIIDKPKQTRQTAKVEQRSLSSGSTFLFPIDYLNINKPTIAYAIPTVVSAVQNIANDIATLALKMYKYTNDGKSLAPNHRLQKLLKYRPNPEQTAFSFKQALMANALIYGNGYAEIQRNNGGLVENLWLIPSERVEPKVKYGKLVYKVRNANGSVDLNPEDMFHIKYLSTDGYIGLNPMEVFCNVLGLASDMITYSAAFFKTGGQVNGILKSSETVDPQVQKFLKQEFVESHRTPGPAFLDANIDYTPIGTNPEQSQFTKSLEMITYLLARIWNIPIHKVIGEKLQLSGNMEVLNMQYLQQTLTPYLYQWEQELYTKLIPDSEKEVYFAEFLPDSILRLDRKTQADIASIEVPLGLTNRNEYRVALNREPYEGGSSFLIPTVGGTIKDENKTEGPK